jgi:transcriptional regulator GlxA family with amidase domain
MPDLTLALAAVAARLGVERSASAQAAEVFELQGAIDIPSLARALGCSLRTLQRRLKEEGGSAEQLRACGRIVRATRLLRTNLTLTQVAMEAGFADAAHMSRAFKVACGNTPTTLRSVCGARSTRLHAAA